MGGLLALAMPLGLKGLFLRTPLAALRFPAS